MVKKGEKQIVANEFLNFVIGKVHQLCDEVYYEWGIRLTILHDLVKSVANFLIEKQIRILVQ